VWRKTVTAIMLLEFAEPGIVMREGKEPKNLRATRAARKEDYGGDANRDKRRGLSGDTSSAHRGGMAVDVSYSGRHLGARRC
jgi:hypothetical protein